MEILVEELRGSWSLCDTGNNKQNSAPAKSLTKEKDS